METRSDMGLMHSCEIKGRSCFTQVLLACYIQIYIYIYIRHVYESNDKTDFVLNILYLVLAKVLSLYFQPMFQHCDIWYQIPLATFGFLLLLICLRWHFGYYIVCHTYFKSLL